MPKEIVYTDVDRDYPKGYYKGAVGVVKMRNAMRKAGYELVRAHNERLNNVLTGSSGFIRDPKSGLLVYFSADASFSDKILYRTAAHDHDYTGGYNRHAGFGELADAVRTLFAHPECW